MATYIKRILSAVSARILRWISAPGFFYVIPFLLIFQSLWIALTARYPQAFDENFHFGLIQLHAGQWLPFFTSHIPGAEVYGPLSRDPSYFYHFIFSLPYRLLTAFSLSQEAVISILRILNIGIFVGGLYVYRKVLAELGLSRRVAHAALLFFVLTPIVPLLAAHINYDNLIFVLTGLIFLYGIRYLKQLYTEGTYNVTALAWIGVYVLLSGIIKYTSLPLSIAFVGIIAGVSVWKNRTIRQDKNPKRLVQWPAKAPALLLVAAIILLGGLALERYGTNLVRYGHPVPDCSKVLTIQQCQSYSPWARDYLFAANHPKPTLQAIVVYPFVWVHRMVFETMFTISSRFEADGVRVLYIPAPPLTVANYTAWTIVVAGGLLAVVFTRRLWSQIYLRWILIAIACYGAVLFLKNLSMYLHTGEAMAIHGRYLIPMYPVLYAALALVFGWATEKFVRPRSIHVAKTGLFAVTLLLLIHGAGLIVWIFRSDPSWYWTRDSQSIVYRINRPVQNFIHRVIIP